MKEKAAIPVTVLSGFLGSGKTTILKHLLSNREGRRFALIVNDMSELNVDAELLGEAEVLHADEKLVAMSNGCICCTLREDLLIEVRALAESGAYDAIIIESSGISEPLPVAETFTFEDENGVSLMDVARLDTLVTVVDVSRFRDIYMSTKTLSDTGEGTAPEDTRSLAHLLVDQVEFANVIVFTKTDLVTPEVLERTRSIVKTLNPDAVCIEAVHGDVPSNAIIDTKLFSLDDAAQNPLWLKELRGEHVPETEEYGISSFVYTANRPFAHDKLKTVLENGSLASLLRSKGFAWIDTKPDVALMWSQAGNQMMLEPYGHWRVRTDGSVKGEQKIVCIGIDLDQQAVRDVLDSALITD